LIAVSYRVEMRNAESAPARPAFYGSTVKHACFLTASQTKELRPESRTDHQEKYLELLRQY
jgi:hypothetical protein